MTESVEPVEEEVEEIEEEEEEGHGFSPAPVDDPAEDVVYTGKFLKDGDLDDIGADPEEEEAEEVEEAAVEGEVEEAAEEEEHVEEHVEEPAEEGTEEPSPEIDGHRVKINGEEYQLSTDDLIAGYQQAAASQERFQRAAEVEKAARTVIDNVLDPDRSVDTMIDLYADQMGGDRNAASEKVDEIIGKRIQHLIDLEEMSTEERQVHDLTVEKDQMAEQLQAQQRVQYERQQEEHINYQNTQAVPLLDAAITKYNLDVGSAQDAEASQILAEFVRQGHTITQDLADQTVADVVNRRAELLHSTLNGMSAEDLMLTNPDLASQVQERKVEEIKASRTTNTEASSKGSTSRRRKAKTDTEYSDSNDFFNSTDF